MEEIYEIRS